MRKALVRLEQLQAENTRQAKEIEQLKANERYLLDQRGALEQKLAAALRENTPLRERYARLWNALKTIEANAKLSADTVRAIREGTLSPQAEAVIRALGDVADLLALSEKPPAVTGTTSDSAPIRKPAAGDAKGTK
jgi:chromosome segregation ATPase